jgi:hypothetical protein
MFETLSIMPIAFWAVLALLIGGGLWAFQHRNDGYGLPALAVLATVGTWYVGDAFYNDYAGNYAKEFDAGTMALAWWQVAWFLLAFLWLVPVMHRWLNRRYLQQRSGVLQLFQHGVGYPVIQQQLNLIYNGAACVWGGLFLIAVLVLKGRIIYYLFPFLGYKASPWSHGQIGHGFDCFSILAVYLQLLSATLFGVVAALATNRRIQFSALVFCLLAWPFFIFDRTRNTMLAMVIPAVLGWVFLRMRGGLVKKALVLLLCFCVVNFWMKFVIANRSHTSITQAFAQKGLSLSAEKKVHNEGLNMYEELCWISTFLDDGKYQINWGERYFGELVNPIPRALWPGKPLIGLKYAIARGHHVINASGAVDTTISTGMIGQGVTNFGRFFGPLAAAILMSLWVAWLARLDLNIHALGHLPLYSLGLILTFNLGRDITLITLYPFIFGAVSVWALERFRGRQPRGGTVSSPVPAVSQQSVQRAPQTRRAKTGPGGAFGQRFTRGGFVKRDQPGHRASRQAAGNQPSAAGQGLK